jgi:multidrug efflux pump subunit AcrB
MNPRKLGFAGTLARAFINSRLTPLFIISAILIGLGAVLLLPREEEPQIVVPMIDVFVEMPGASPREIESRVTKPVEKLLWEIPGVEYIYSTSSPGMTMAVVRFRVGEDEERAVVRLNQKLSGNYDALPPGAGIPLVKLRSIDDVPVLAVTLSSSAYDHFTLRRVAAELHDSVKEIPNVSEVRMIGGQRRQLRVVLDPQRMTAYGVGAASLMSRLQRANVSSRAGRFSSDNDDYIVETSGFLRSAEEVGSVVVGVSKERPVYLRDIATIQDGPEEAADYVMLGNGPASGASESGLFPAVTLSIAKRKGTNAIDIADAVLSKIENSRGLVIPTGIDVTVTRNYGETAAEKSNELLLHMAIAILSVSILIWVALGRREAAVIALAIPVTLALTLAVFYLYGYTLNRVTLFALIFSIGILVDDAIVVVENIVRHRRLPENRGRPLHDVAVEAVDEVGNPTILATFAVIAAILPMAFVRGLMGPYMMPIPIGASSAMVFSLLVAFVVTPWASVRLLKAEAADHGPGESTLTRAYRRVMGALLHRVWLRRGFLAGVALLLLSALSLFGLRVVRVKMLPFDNKSEFQVVIDMPEGSTLEQTAAVSRGIGEYLHTVPEVRDYQLYIGTASPYNFNGLVRHYFLRSGPNVADIQVNLAARSQRKAQSHDIARRVRQPIQEIAAVYGANVKIAEVPPGPPVLQTLVAEIYGPDYDRQIQIAHEVKRIFQRTPGIADIDWYVEDQQPRVQFVVDQAKAALHGVSASDVSSTLQLAIGGAPAGLLHLEGEKETVPIILRIPRSERSGTESLKQITVSGGSGWMVPVGELTRIESRPAERNIYHKNLMPVVYVTADVAGAEESPIYAILKLNEAIDGLILPEGYGLERYVATQPEARDRFAMKWDGEWHISYEVFRDLGLAFAAVLILIYVLVTGWFQSFKIPLTIMTAIPFSLVGIVPAHGGMNAFFTATSMIGFIAGAGIVVRNSIILVDFIQLRLREGMPLDQAVIDAGAVRFRPMMLTAAAVIVGAGVILFDPIFQGLALSLMAGEIASLFLSRMTVPILFYVTNAARTHPDNLTPTDPC